VSLSPTAKMIGGEKGGRKGHRVSGGGPNVKSAGGGLTGVREEWSGQEILAQ